jgi:diketogulonate reductase-like aldo/keto reductase
MSVPSVTLNNGQAMPQIGFGLWQVDAEETGPAVAAALRAGYRHFDSAQFYRNEHAMAEALKAGGVPRAELFVTTKISNDNQSRVDESFDDSFKRIDMEYIDLLLLHFPVTGLRQDAWKSLEKIAASGRVKSIGVSNYTIRHLEELLADCSVKPAVNQVELHVFLQQPELVAFCQKNDIAIQAYSPLAHGHGIDNPTLEELADTYGKTPAQVMLRWCIEAGTVPLPKSVHDDRIAENINIFDFKLTQEDMEKLKSLDCDMRTAWDPTDVE